MGEGRTTGHHWRSIAAVGLTLAMAAVPIAATAAPASASASANPAPVSWTAPFQVDGHAPFSENNAPEDVSCPTTSLCVVVDSGGGVVTTTTPTGDADSWSPVADVSFPGTYGELTSVSCASASLCVAAGQEYEDGVGEEATVAASSSPTGGSSAWPSTTGVDGLNTLEDISCTSGTSTPVCVAVDDAGDVVTSTDPTAASPSWTATDVDGSEHLTGISCVTPSAGPFCVAVDEDGNVITSTDPAAASPTWTVTNVDGTNRLLAISCVATPDVCAAGDNEDDVVASADPAAATPAWTVTPITGASGDIGTISCVSTSSSSFQCVAGNYSNALFSTDPSGGASDWSFEEGADGDEQGFVEMSCASAALCLSTNGDLYDQALILVSSATASTQADSWSDVGPIDGTNTLSAVACTETGSTLCVAGDRKGNLTTSTDPAGGAADWTEQNVDSTRINALSCPTASQCFAGDSGGNVLASSDPGGGPSDWTSTQATGAGVQALSCLSSTMCVGGDSNGDILTSTNPTSGTPTWNVTQVDTLSGIATMSCVSSSLCVAGDAEGNIFTSTNPTSGTPPGSGATWTETDMTGNGYVSDGGDAPLSCIAGPTCVAFRYSYNAGSIVAMVSTDPASGEVSAWTSTPVSVSEFMVSLSCAAGPLCVGVDYSGNAYESTDPSSAWSSGPIDSAAGGLTGVSCASHLLCAAVDTGEDVVVGTGESTVPLDVTLDEGSPATGTVTSSPSGIDCGSSCSNDYAWDSEVTLTETPGPKSDFAGWGGACSGTATTCTLTLLQAEAVTAAFDPPPQRVTVSRLGTGTGTVVSSPAGISCPPTCSATFAHGTQVTLTPTPSADSYTNLGRFSGCEVSYSSGTCSVTVDQDTPVIAEFETGAMKWSSPVTIDPGQDLNGVSCPSASLCVAAAEEGDVLTSTTPTGGSSDWHRTNVDGTNSLYALSCASKTLCVAVDDDGDVVTSTDPTGGSSDWHVADVDGSNVIEAISCPSVSLCVAVDNDGDVVTSTDPTGGSSDWHVADVDSGAGIYAVSCPSVSLCVAGDSGGRVLTSTHPAGGASAWTSTKETCIGSSCLAVDAVSCFAVGTSGSSFACYTGSFEGYSWYSTDPAEGASSTWTQADSNEEGSTYAMSCPSSSLCTAVGTRGAVDTATTSPASGGTPVWLPSVDADGTDAFYGISCPSSSLCVAVDDDGHVLSGTAWGDDDTDLESVGTVSATNAWAVGEHCTAHCGTDADVVGTLIEHWNGTAWSQTKSPSPGPARNDLYGVSADSATDAWAVGYYYDPALDESRTLIERWNGKAWAEVASPDPSGSLNQLWSVSIDASNGHAFAVGYYRKATGAIEALVLEWNGTKWAQVTSPDPSTTDNELYAVSVDGTNGDAWAVGEYETGTDSYDGLVLEWNGTKWAQVTSPDPSTTDNELYAVSVDASNGEAFAVGTDQSPTGGYDTLVLRWNSSKWSQVSSADPGSTDNGLDGVSIDPKTGDAWAVGYSQSSTTGAYDSLGLKWNGTKWTSVTTPDPSTTDNEMNGVSLDAAGGGFSVGYYKNGSASAEDPLTLQWSGSAWTG